MKKIIFIGGGASSFFCAANLDEKKYQITILEQNANVLQKVKISGGGRCNVSHACFDPKELVQYYPRGSRELLSVFTKFQPGDTMEWFQERNVPLKIENDDRIFPESNSSQSIINCFQKIIEEKNITVKTQSVVLDIIIKNSGYTIFTKEEELEADFVVFSPGSSPKTLKIAEKLGHSLVPAVPSLFTFNIKDALLQDLPGTSFANAEVSIPSLKTEESGPLLITHWGLSGPAILKISAWKARELATINYKFTISINFLGIDFWSAEEIFINYKNKNTKKSILQGKMFDVTNRFWQRVLELSKIPFNKNIAALTKQEIHTILNFLCKKELIVTGKSTHKDEFVTAGGVDLKEIDFKNMSSKILPNFYLAGEVLNIDAVTGGFNFQACWSEAWLIAQDLNDK